ncbi:MAG: response regulator [Gammaproteobacteria bacterium]
MEAQVPISLVIADDHPMMLFGLTALFEAESDFSVLDTVSNGEEAVRAVRERCPDVLLLDIVMPEPDGLTVLQILQAEGLQCKTVLHTYRLDDDRLLEAVQYGVRGVVLKTQPPPILLQAVRTVHAGDRWLEMESVGRLLVNTLERDAARRRACELLTQRELEVVKVVAQGLRNRAVAELLHIQEGTVRIHLHNIYEKLALDGRGALIAFARQNGLI